MIIGYADFETAHGGDFEAVGLQCRTVGHTVHVFAPDPSNDMDPWRDTKCIPRVWVKCGAVVWRDKYGRERHETNRSVQGMLKSFLDHRMDTVYFHNLAFDDSYITWQLLTAGDLPVDVGWTASSGRRLMGTMGHLYSHEIVFTGPYDEKQHRHRTFTCKLLDSMKIWNRSLRSIGKDFGVPKGDEALTVGYTKALDDYCVQDCRIVMTAMEWYFDKCREFAPDRATGWMTAASTSYNLGMLHATEELGTKAIKRFFPSCTEENGFPDWLRSAYKGATPLLDDRIRGKVLDGLYVLDVNSMYPYQMMTKILPIGKPIKMDAETFDPNRTNLLWVMECDLVATLKDGHRATYLNKRIKTGETCASYIDTLTFGCTEVIDSITWQTLNRDYDVVYMKPVNVIGFHGRRGVFREFLSYWYRIKQDSKKSKMSALNSFAKLVINSFYGKFGSNPEREICEWELGDDGCLKVVTREETRVTKNPLYLPFALFVTAYARDMISLACNAVGWDHVVYTDTDSLHITGLSEEQIRERIRDAGMTIDPIMLGAWDLESYSDQAIYIRAKGYFHFDADGNTTEIKMAGANSFPDLDHVDKIVGKELHGIQRYAANVKGGKLIMERPTTIDASDYSAMQIRVKIPGLSYEESARRFRDEGIWD